MSKRVLIIGLGRIGRRVAQYVKNCGFETFGYDIDQSKMNELEKYHKIPTTIDFTNFDVYIICVSTHMNDDIFTPETRGLFLTIEKISKYGKDGAIVSIESTIPYGTSQKISNIFNHRLHLVHVPHRWFSLEEEKHGVNQLRVIGGIENCCLIEGLKFYNSQNTHHETSLGIPLHVVNKIEIAELTKLIENAHRYLQIAFAEDLYLFCQDNKIDFGKLRNALNTKWNVDILEARDGIGGECLPKDLRMLLNSGIMTSKILHAALEVDMEYKMRKNEEKRNKKTL